MILEYNKKDAGPWLGANTVSFGVAGAFVPILQTCASKLWSLCFALAALTIMTMCLLYYTEYYYMGKNHILNAKEQEESDANITSLEMHNTTKENENKMTDVDKRYLSNDADVGKIGNDDIQDIQAPHFQVEAVIGSMVFLFIGSNVTAVAYLPTYISDTMVIGKEETDKLVLSFWIAMSFGRLVSIQDLRHITENTLHVHLVCLCIGGIIVVFLILNMPSSPEILWVCFPLYGLFNGPCLGYCYDLLNKLTFPTDSSMSMVRFIT